MQLRFLLIIFTFAIIFPTIGFGQESKFLNTNDGVIHYKTFGKGKPMVIINGGPGMNSEGFSALADQISKLGFLVIIYDQRGTGKSEMKTIDTSSITMKKMVEDLEVLRKHLGFEKWMVFGQSFGGLLATQYLHSNPNSISKIIFSSSAGLNLDFMNYIGDRIQNNLSQLEKDSMEYYQKIISTSPQDKPALLGRARQLASAYVFNKMYIPIMAQRMLQVNLKINELVYDDLDKNKFDYTGKFKNNKTPILIFQGMNDVIAFKSAEDIAKSISKSKLIKLDNCGHYPWLDRPEIFWTEINAFLKN